jgi:intracellular sulfur oxidation DsrE/DsrF family protein
MKNSVLSKTPRRKFLSSLAMGAATFGVGSLMAPLSMGSDLPDAGIASEAEAWFDKVKGKHRMIFDVPKPNGIMPFAWPRVFIKTNVATGTPEDDLGLVVVLRHGGIPYALDSSLWKKYKFGEAFTIDDPKTKAPSIRNPFQKPGPEDFVAPGLGNMMIGVEELQASGVLFCVCDLALSIHAREVAGKGDPAEVKKEFVAGLLPGVQLMPSGIWAVGRAQEKQCAYVYTG